MREIAPMIEKYFHRKYTEVFMDKSMFFIHKVARRQLQKNKASADVVKKKNWVYARAHPDKREAYIWILKGRPFVPIIFVNAAPMNRVIRFVSRARFALANASCFRRLPSPSYLYHASIPHLFSSPFFSHVPNQNTFVNPARWRAAEREYHGFRDLGTTHFCGYSQKAHFKNGIAMIVNSGKHS